MTADKIEYYKGDYQISTTDKYGPTCFPAGTKIDAAYVGTSLETRTGELTRLVYEGGRTRWSEGPSSWMEHVRGGVQRGNIADRSNDSEIDNP